VVFFWQNHCLNHGWAGFTRINESMQGYAWASQAGAMLSNPFASELARDSQTPSPFCYAKWPYDDSSEIFGRKCGVALGLQAEMCCEKASASPLASVFSTTDPAFAQRIKTMIFLNFYPCLSESSVVKKRSIRCANGAVTWGQRLFTIHS
jgi:hypothetical protein